MSSAREAGTPGPARILFRLTEPDGADGGTIAIDVEIERYTTYGVWYQADGELMLSPWAEVIEVTQT